MAAFSETMKGLGTAKLATLAGVGVLLLGFFAFLALNLSQPTMAPLFTNLPVEESGKIVKELETMDIPYELKANGTIIEVPNNQALRLRMSMAEKGLPSSGSIVGYEIFDRSEALGVSNFVQNVNIVRALEGELGRTIGAFSHVESARVHLVLPKRELFTRDKQQPTASVAIKMRGAGELSKNEIAAIRHLIASAVPGLKPSQITVVDNNGALLARGSADEESREAMAATTEEYRVTFENRTKNMLEELLEQSIGAGKVKAQVFADINFDRIVTNSEIFDPEGQVARSVQTVEEREQSKEADKKATVSVANSLPNANQQQEGGAENSSLSEKTDETTNYEISKTVKNQVQETGRINKLAVAVLVDGTYNKDQAGDLAYTPRSEEELKKLEALVKSAIGYDESRGDTVEVVNMQFISGEKAAAEEGAFDWLKRDFQSIIQTLVLGVVAVLAILLIIRPLVTRALEASRTALTEDEPLGALAGPGGAAQLTDQTGRAIAGGEEEEDDMLIDVARIQGRIKSSTFRKINEIIEQHPDETLGILRQWLYKEAA